MGNNKDKINQLKVEISKLKSEDDFKINQRKIDDFTELLEQRKVLVDLVDEIEKPIELAIFNLIKERNAKTSSLKDEYDSLTNLINDNCYHPSPNKVTTKTIEGGYLDRGSITKIFNCSICGVEVDRQEHDTGYS